MRDGAWMVLAVFAAGVLAGCERKDSAGASKAAAGRATLSGDATVEPPRLLPTYTFAQPELATQYPEVAQFVRAFLETCLAGDYEAYRGLVSRFEPPIDRDRFTQIYHGIRGIVIESIERLEAGAGQPTIYRVISTIDADPTQKKGIRRKNSGQVAILVVPEDGGWRMRPAPASLQPRDASTATRPSEARDADTPTYPWDEGGDE